MSSFILAAAAAASSWATVACKWAQSMTTICNFLSFVMKTTTKNSNNKNFLSIKFHWCNAIRFDYVTGDNFLNWNRNQNKLLSFIFFVFVFSLSKKCKTKVHSLRSPFSVFLFSLVIFILLHMCVGWLGSSKRNVFDVH